MKLNTWQIELFGKFLEKLKTTPDGDGSLLDHSLILYGSGMSESDTHSPLDVPLPDGRQGGGAFKGNRHLAAPKGTQLANVMLDRRAEVRRRDRQFGVSTGAFAL